MTYGLSYMGSKSKIADWVLSYIPSADNFYDLCAGGCAMTHAAMLSHKFKNFIINDIQDDVPQLFIDAIQGKYRNETRWISREDFFRLKDTDAYVRYVWSFGNKGATYLYGKDKEKIKHAFHLAIYENNGYGLETFGIKIPREILLMKYGRNKYLAMKSFINTKIGRLDLQSLEGLNRLQSLERLNRLPILYKDSYNEVPIKENSILYCDIPYKGTGTYQCEAFDYDNFYDWCAKQTELVIISEYNMPKDKFYCIAEKDVKSSMSPTSNSTKATERLYIPIHQKDMYYSKINSNKIQLSLF